MNGEDQYGYSSDLAVAWFASMWWLTLCDGPLPVADGAFLVIAGVLVVTDIVIETIDDIREIRHKKTGDPGQDWLDRVHP